MRRAAVTVSIKGHDVTLDLMPYLVSLTYTDKADEELDDLQIVLEDREGIWQGDWLPQTGDVIEASILTENWRDIGAVEELPCGKFEVDEMELESSAEGGDTVTVKAVPAAVKSSLMLQKKTRSWEKTPITTVSPLADALASPPLPVSSAGSAGVPQAHSASAMQPASRSARIFFIFLPP